LRNNFVVNKADGNENTSEVNETLTGEESIANGETDGIRAFPNFVIYQHNNNDYGDSEPYAIVENRTQDIVDLVTSSPYSCSVYRLSPVIPNSQDGDYPGNSNYYRNVTRWVCQNITGTLGLLNSSLVLGNETGNTLEGYSSDDGVHLNDVGYNRLGNFLQREFPHFSVKPSVVLESGEVRPVGSNHRVLVTLSHPGYANVSWGDGSYSNVSVTGGSRSFSHIYGSVGTYSVSVLAGNDTTDGPCLLDSASISLTARQLNLGESLNDVFATFVPLLLVLFFVGVALAMLGISLKQRRE
jgi:prepilin-type processing-associated H-X9-DG protein